MPADSAAPVELFTIKTELCYQERKVLFVFAIFFFFFWSHCTACGILVPGPGIEPIHFALEALNLNHWTARKVPGEEVCKTFKPEKIDTFN